MHPVPRSILFIPAVRGDLAAKAPQAGADVVVLDLEDGVAPARKPEARVLLAEHIGVLVRARQRVWVRVNSWPVGVPEDIAAIGQERPEAIVLPKARSAVEVRLVLESLEAAGDYTTPLVATIEDAIGVFASPTIATASARVGALGLGAEDMSVSLNVRPSIESLAVPAQFISMAAASAGIPCFGIPGSLADYTNLTAFEESARRAKAIGFWGALCVHPAQVPIANAVFSVSPEEVVWARKVLERAEATVAVGSEVGMIDAPVILRARRLMERNASNGSGDR